MKINKIELKKISRGNYGIIINNGKLKNFSRCKLESIKEKVLKLKARNQNLQLIGI